MNKPVTVVVVLWLIVLSWFSFQSNRPVAKEVEAAIPKWEYTSTYGETKDLYSSTGDLLNALGDDGWELCSAVSNESKTIFTLKRRKG